MGRIVSLVLALAVGAAAATAICHGRSPEASSELARRAETLAQENERLTSERDQLAREVGESRRLALELKESSDAMRGEFQEKLARLEQLVAALVGTRPVGPPVDAPTVSPSAGEGVRDAP